MGMTMLDRIVLWADIAATAADVLLLARVFQLRLQRLYLFITLACTLAVLFDFVQLWFGLNSDESQRLARYSRFLYAFLYPLVAWDVFEEMKEQVSQMRRVAAGRLISSIFFAAFFGFVVSLLMGGDQEKDLFSTTLAFVLWAGYSAATLAFLWSLQRVLKTQHMVRPHNTFVWMTYFQLVLLAELAGCFSSILGSLLNTTAQGVMNVCLLLYGLLITVWCAVRLKRIPSDVSTPANAGAS